MHKVHIQLSDHILKDIKDEQEHHVRADKHFFNQPTLVKMLIKEALAFRRKYRDVISEINQNRLEYETELYARGDVSVFAKDEAEPSPVPETRRRWNKSKIDGLPSSYSELIDAIKKLGNYAHTKDIATLLKMKEGTVTSRIVRAMDKHLVQRLDWGVYTCVVVDPFEPRHMTAAEKEALSRARMWVKKSRGLEL